MQTDKIAAIASKILEQHQRAYNNLSVTPLAGGANNRVFKIENDSDCYLFKSYYHDEIDLKDRASTDFNFCTFAWNHGIHFVPKPIGISAQEHAALYEFIEGRRLTSSEITPSLIDQAVTFFIQLNQHRSDLKASKLPVAAEACFSLKEHFDCIQQRVAKLQSITTDQYLGAEAKNIIDHQILPQWNALINTVDLTDTQLLPQEERALSPSDFGFHNSLLQPDGTLHFFDFEYAGWDDPAKMMADFFCQPDLPIPESAFKNFCSRTVDNFLNPEIIIQRAQKLLPFYRIKWCCILLNEFLLHHVSRRRFALTSVSEHERKEQQLKKAKNMLATLEK